MKYPLSVLCSQNILPVVLQAVKCIILLHGCLSVSFKKLLSLVLLIVVTIKNVDFAYFTSRYFNITCVIVSRLRLFTFVVQERS